MRNIGDTVNASTLELILQTRPNQYNRWSRLFQLGTAVFQKIKNVSFLDAGWIAGNGGTIINENGSCRLQIDENTNYTFTTREQGFDLDLNLNVGFGIIQLQEVSANVPRIELWSRNGKFLRYAEPLDTGKFFLPFGNVEIVDVRIVIEGEPNSFITISELSLWEWLPVRQ